MNDQIDETEYDSAAALYTVLLFLSVVGIAATVIIKLLGESFP